MLGAPVVVAPIKRRAAMEPPVPAIVTVVADGFARVGVPVNVGELAKTFEPVPVTDVAPVPPFATARFPVMFDAFTDGACHVAAVVPVEVRT